MLVKYISESRVEPYRGLVEVDGVVFTNDEEKALAAGFKPMIIDEQPAAKEGVFLMLCYEDGADAVYGKWKEEVINEVI